MAQVLPFNGFASGNDKKNSQRECVNYIPVRHDSGALSEYTLNTTTGIDGGISNSYARLDKPFIWTTSDGTQSAFMVVSQDAPAGAGTHLISTDGNSILTDNELFQSNFPPAASYSAAGATVACVVSELTNGVQSIAGIPSTLTGIQTQGLPSGVVISDVAYLGDRFLFMADHRSDVGVQKYVYYSDILDPTSVDSLSFFSDTTQTSESTGMHVLGNRLYLFSKSGYSVWNNTPSVNSPFAIQKGSSGSIGLVSRNAKTEVGGVLYFIGLKDGKPSLYSMSSGGISYLGNEYLNDFLRFATSATLFSFSDGEKTFICISSGRAYCYDIETGEIHKRETKNETGSYVKWRVFDSKTVGINNIMFGSKPAGGGIFPDEIMIANTNREIGTEFGLEVDRHLITSPFNSDGVSNIVREVCFQSSMDYSGGIPAAEQVLNIESSSDFGETYSAAKSVGFGGASETTKLMRVMSLGFYRQAFVFKISTSTIYPHKILKMLIRLEKGFRKI